MSVEAIAYVKSLDLGSCEKARLLMYVIGENTFNDTFICALGNEQLAYEVRANERTVRRQLEDLIVAGKIIRKSRYPEKSGGRLPDALRIVGFKKWYLTNNKSSRRRTKTEADATGQNVRKPLPAKMSGRRGGLADKMSGRLPDTAMSGVTGHQVSGSYKETRTYPVNKNAHECASEDFKFDLEGKGVRDRLLQRHGPAKFDAWFHRLRFAISESDSSLAFCTAEDRLVRDWVCKNFEPDVAAACRAEWPTVSRVQFVWMSPAKTGAKEFA